MLKYAGESGGGGGIEFKIDPYFGGGGGGGGEEKAAKELDDVGVVEASQKTGEEQAPPLVPKETVEAGEEQPIKEPKKSPFTSVKSALTSFFKPKEPEKAANDEQPAEQEPVMEPDNVEVVDAPAKPKRSSFKLPRRVSFKHEKAPAEESVMEPDNVEVVDASEKTVEEQAPPLVPKETLEAGEEQPIKEPKQSPFAKSAVMTRLRRLIKPKEPEKAANDEQPAEEEPVMEPDNVEGVEASEKTVEEQAPPLMPKETVGASEAGDKPKKSPGKSWLSPLRRLSFKHKKAVEKTVHDEPVKTLEASDTGAEQLPVKADDVAVETVGASEAGEEQPVEAVDVEVVEEQASPLVPKETVGASEAGEKQAVEAVDVEVVEASQKTVEEQASPLAPKETVGASEAGEEQAVEADDVEVVEASEKTVEEQPIVIYLPEMPKETVGASETGEEQPVEAVDVEAVEASEKIELVKEPEKPAEAQ